MYILYIDISIITLFMYILYLYSRYIFTFLNMSIGDPSFSCNLTWRWGKIPASTGTSYTLTHWTPWMLDCRRVSFKMISKHIKLKQQDFGQAMTSTLEKWSDHQSVGQKWSEIILVIRNAKKCEFVWFRLSCWIQTKNESRCTGLIPDIRWSLWELRLLSPHPVSPRTAQSWGSIMNKLTLSLPKVKICFYFFLNSNCWNWKDQENMWYIPKCLGIIFLTTHE